MSLPRLKSERDGKGQKDEKEKEGDLEKDSNRNNIHCNASDDATGDKIRNESGNNAEQSSHSRGQ